MPTEDQTASCICCLLLGNGKDLSKVLLLNSAQRTKIFNANCI